ncbi:hypothetical protein WBG78_27130 [Chryseolinea sp. T2]|uniref:hypothetical protein n=1 Tax=Chryseolinea sp. T2 TaxID=3129255 RepID=UPI003076A41E
MNLFRKHLIWTMLFVGCYVTVHAQIDSLSKTDNKSQEPPSDTNKGILQKTPSPDTILTPIDKFQDSTRALKQRALQKIDSATNFQFVSDFKDSVGYYQQRIDSVKQWMSGEVSGLQKEYEEQANRVTQIQQRLQTKVDSLSRMALTDNKLAASLDSVNQKLGDLQQEFQSKLSDTKSKAVEKLGAIEVPPEMQQQVNDLKSSISKLVPAQVAGKLSFDVPGLDVLSKGMPSLSNLTSGITDVVKVPNGTAITEGVSIPNNTLPNTTLPNANIAKSSTNLSLPSADPVPQLKKVTGVTGQTEKVTGELKTIQEQPIDKLAESKVTSLSEAQEIQKRAKLEGVDALKSEEALKAEMKRQAQAAAVDHFSGKEAQLKAAMEKISKYKQKYSEMKSMADLAKKPTNPLKENKFHERLLPGLGFQLLKKSDDILVDFNPYVGYKFTRRITAGAGWNQRVAYNWDNKSFSHSSQIYGPRVYGEFNLSKGFSPRLEVELMNTLVPPATVKQGDPHGRQWVPGAFAGMKKQYKLYKQLRGTASVMFRLFDPKRQSPYGDVVNARFGFEYVIKKRKR